MAAKDAAGGGGGSGRVLYADNKPERGAMRLENPFTLKVGQVFTGFGIGCGVGIGMGRPLNLGKFYGDSLCLFLLSILRKNIQLNPYTGGLCKTMPYICLCS